MQSTVKLPFKNDTTRAARGIRNTQELLANHVKFQLAEGLFENKKPFVLQNSNQYFFSSLGLHIPSRVLMIAICWDRKQ